MVDTINAHTVMRIIKLNLFPVPVRLHSDYGKLIFVIISPVFAIFKTVVHRLEPGVTPSNSASHQAPNYVQRSLILQKNDELMTKNQFTVIGVQPHRNRKYFQFNNAHDCT